MSDSRYEPEGFEEGYGMICPMPLHVENSTVYNAINDEVVVCDEPEIAAHIALAVNLHREAFELLERLEQNEVRDCEVSEGSGLCCTHGYGSPCPVPAARSLLARAREEGE